MYTNTKNQGDAGLGMAIAWATKQGYPVSLPLTDSQDYDLVVEIDNVLQKVQVKTGTAISSHNVPMVRLAVCGGNKSSSSRKTADQQVWDFLFCWHIAANKMFFIPKSAVTVKDTFHLGDKVADYQVSL